MCSFIIISVSAFSTRFELKSESVRLLSATRKPSLSALSSLVPVIPAMTQFCSLRNCRRGWPVDAPKV